MRNILQFTSIPVEIRLLETGGMSAVNALHYTPTLAAALIALSSVLREGEREREKKMRCKEGRNTIHSLISLLIYKSK